MRENPGIKQVFRRFKPRRVWLLALGVALTPLMAAQGWAETFALDSVDFVSKGGKTDIILHTGSIVPVKKVQVSSRKMILEIEQVNTEHTVRTNFTGARNISHVIMQPLGRDKIRMIIRGEDLGTPNVAFFNGNRYYESPVYNGFGIEGEKLAEDNRLALQHIQEEGIQPATLGSENPDKAAETSAVDFTAINDSEPLTLQSSPPEAEEDLAPISLPAAETVGSGNGISGFFEQWVGSQTGNYIPYGLLALLLLGLGGFVRHKLNALGRREPNLEDLIEAQAQGKRVSFREMAEAYRSKHEGKTARPAATVRKSTEEIIGLRSLKQVETPPTEQASPVSRPAAKTPSLEELMALVQKAQPAVKPAAAPKKQAIQQYAKTEAQPKPKAKSRQAADALMASQIREREVKTAQWQREDIGNVAHRVPKPGISSPANPINRAPAARKSVPTSQPGTGKPALAQAPAPNGPLPGNPEVLNFLRNVAELMEKDGKPEIARNIHKNLNPGLMQ